MLYLGHAYKKVNSTFVDNVEDLDIVMPMDNLLECSGNYSITSRIVCGIVIDIK